jgi:DNA polymerase-3 subunit gamma/tau
VLQRVKERKITVHAWLIDGEPVSAADQTVLIAFKSAMHRETTEKPAHKQLIEQVLQETFGKPLKLATVMSKEWKEAQSGFREPPEPMELKVEDADKSQEEWIDEAIRLFGENIVVIKE